MKIGSLFSGYGGLDMAVAAAIGGTVVWHVENDKAASKLLAHHHPDTPNLGDITKVPWADMEPVDILTGGFPCQDVSHAGQRKGLGPDTRSGLWEHMARAITVLQPSLVVIENVRGLLSARAHSDMEPCPWCLGDDQDRPALRALGAVLGDLAELGYDTRWCGVRAADAGAPHGRFRVFIVAQPADTKRGGLLGGRGEPLGGGGREAAAQGQPQRVTQAVQRVAREGCGSVDVDPEGDGRNQGRPQPTRLKRGPDAALSGHGPDADPHGVGQVRSRSARRRGAGPADDHLTAADTDDHGRVRRAQLDSEPHPGLDGAHRGHADRLGVETRPAGGGEAAADTGRAGRDQGAEVLRRRQPEPVNSGQVDWGQYAPAIHRWQSVLGRAAPAPTQPGRNGQPRLSPLFVEWLMGLPAGHVTDVPGLTRNDQLKLLGNGVVPQQAALALALLLPHSHTLGAAA